MTTTESTLYDVTSITSGSIFYDSCIAKPNKTHKQVKVAIFNVTRDENYEIIDSTFDQEVWVKQKNGVSLEAATMKQIGLVIDPDFKIIREISSVTL